MKVALDIDPVKFEIFAHRLWAIGEEGRIALQRVSASPIVVQGGECMSSFYDPSGSMILACSGHLRFAAATSDAIKQLIDWYGRSPGFFDGDQIFFNDPYVAGSHTYDQMVVMPIFAAGKLVAWTASSSHTADVGGSLSGEPTEIFHEGIRITGLKVVEKGEFRDDVFRAITLQCRDPEYVGLDLKSRIAANNVCRRGFLQLVDKFGLEFVEQAGQKLLEDAEALARKKLQAIPDGTWRSRQYVTTRDPKSGQAHVVRIALEARKQADRLAFDFAGTSPEVGNDFNSTLPSTTAHVAVALTNFLFWDVPWSDGKMRPVEMHVPEGSILNCSYPAACNRAPWVGQFVAAAVAECLTKMLYAAGETEDVNAGWFGYWYTGGPGYFYGGHNREGLPTAHGLYDIHGGGLGAAPYRDGVDSGGHMNIPSGGISDIERTEMQYPFLYFSRSHLEDGGGFGKFRGGAGLQRIFMVTGSRDCSANLQPYGALPQGAAGLFGGYGAGTGGSRAVFNPGNLRQRLDAGDYPATAGEIEAGSWGQPMAAAGSPKRIPLPEGVIVTDFTQSGGGFGDPLLREPSLVQQDVKTGHSSTAVAAQVYGVVFDAAGKPDRRSTDARREAIRAERRQRGQVRHAARQAPGEGAAWRSVLRIHESLEIAETAGQLWIRCRHCGHGLSSAAENYKLAALEIERDLGELAGRRVPSGEAYAGCYREYACPGCATLLQVDACSAEDAGEPPLWDLQIAVEALPSGTLLLTEDGIW